MITSDYDRIVIVIMHQLRFVINLHFFCTTMHSILFAYNIRWHVAA